MTITPRFILFNVALGLVPNKGTGQDPALRCDNNNVALGFIPNEAGDKFPRYGVITIM